MLMPSDPEMRWPRCVIRGSTVAIAVGLGGLGVACNSSAPATVDEPISPSVTVEAADDGSASQAGSDEADGPQVEPREPQAVAPATDSVTLPLLDGDVVTLAHLGLDFPDVPLNAAPGATVFAPRDLAGELTEPYFTMNYEPHTVKSVGSTHSIIVGPSSEPFSCPNALMIPVPPDQHAAVGTLLVAPTYWGVGTVVRTGGRPDAPFVNSYPMVDAGTWFVPTEPGEPGTWLHCTVDQTTHRYVSVNNQDGAWLVLRGGVTGRPSVNVSVVPAADCEALPLSGMPEVGDAIRAGSGGRRGAVDDLLVTAVDAEQQRLTAVRANGNGTYRYRLGEFAIGAATP